MLRGVVSRRFDLDKTEGVIGAPGVARALRWTELPGTEPGWPESHRRPLDHSRADNNRTCQATTAVTEAIPVTKHCSTEWSRVSSSKYRARARSGRACGSPKPSPATRREQMRVARRQTR